MADIGIQGFYAAAQAKEFARDFQFHVRTLGPYTEEDLLYITTATIPGKSINNQQVPFFGLNFNVPGTVSFDGSDAWEVTFWCDEGINIRNKAENWIKEIFSEESSTGKYGVPVELATMDLLGKDLNPVRRYEFVGIYPKSIGNISYDKQGNGKPLNFTLTLAYHWWRLVG